MSETNLRKLTGILLIVTPILLNILFTLLGVTFDYPDILRMAASATSAASTSRSRRSCPAARIVVLGGPAMLIGLGGGAASSVGAGASSADLDFASAQRGNPEIQRRAQEVIDRCAALGEANPILPIHDVGAGGISNAFPELVDGAGKGATFDLRKVPLEESGMAPKEIWCNESQERYVLALNPDLLPLFEMMCRRERCPFAIVGVATEERQLVLGEIDLEPSRAAKG